MLEAPAYNHDDPYPVFDELYRRINLFLQGGHALHEFVRILLGHLGRHGVEFVDLGLDVADPFERVFKHGLGLVEFRLLGEIADPGALGGIGLTGEFGVHPGHDPQQGRFPRAIDADNADFGVGVKLQMDVFEDLLGAIGFCQTLHKVDVLIF